MNVIQTKSFRLATYAQGNPDAKKFALVLPGKLETKDYTNMTSHVDYLVTKGFFALSFDPPGTWESPGEISLYTMTNYLKAINELIEHFGNKPTFVIGHSRGASMSIIATMQNSLIGGFAAVFPSLRVDGSWERSDTEKWKEQGYHISMRDLPPGGGPEIKEFRLPYSFYEDQLHYGTDIIDEVKKSDKPKLFFAGKHDPIVDPQVVKDIYAVAGDPKELYELDSDHDYRFHTTLIDEVNAVSGKFLDTYQL